MPGINELVRLLMIINLMTAEVELSTGKGHGRCLLKSTYCNGDVLFTHREV